MNSGYSGTPLAKKLGLKDGFKVRIINAPESYKNWFSDLDIELKKSRFGSGSMINFVHLFCTSLNHLENNLPKIKSNLAMDGMLWVSWPKGTSSISTDLNRDLIRRYILTSGGLVDVKVAAIDDDWSGLKFVYRLKDRK